MIKLGRYQVCFLDLFTDSRTSRLSASKLWLHIANGIMSYIMLHSDSIDWELMAVYGSVVGGSYVAVLFFKLRYASGGSGNFGMADNAGYEHELPEQADSPERGHNRTVGSSRKNPKGGK